METRQSPLKSKKGEKSAPTRRKCQPPQEEEQQQEDYYILYQKGATRGMFIAGKLQSPVNSSSSFLSGCIRDSIAWRCFFSCCCFSLINSVLLYSPDLPVRWLPFFSFPASMQQQMHTNRQTGVKGGKKQKRNTEGHGFLFYVRTNRMTMPEQFQ